MGYLEQAFPDQSQAIADKRNTDPVFDEICRDYELLSADLAGLPVPQSGGSDDAAADMRSSLKGLYEEVFEHLKNMGHALPGAPMSSKQAF